MERRTTKSKNLDAEIDIFIEKRLQYQEGWWSCADLAEYAHDVFRLGCSFIMTWVDCYINPPDDDTLCLLKYDHRTYVVCRYKNKKWININNNKEVIINNTCKWRYLNWPHDADNASGS